MAKSDNLGILVNLYKTIFDLWVNGIHKMYRLSKLAFNSNLGKIFKSPVQTYIKFCKFASFLRGATKKGNFKFPIQFPSTFPPVSISN